MKHLLRPFAFSLLILVAAALGGSAYAQGPTLWGSPKPNPFPTGGTIHIVKFLDDFQRPDTGFVGKDTAIWYTETGGTTTASWKSATITGQLPINPFATGWVNDISFKSATNGAAIITGNTDPADSGILLTTDGGHTWRFDDAPGTPDSGNGIYWNPSNNMLFVSSLDKGLVFSSDNGNSWHPIDTDKDTGRHFTGFAFSDGLNGVVATYGSQQNGFAPSYPWLRTSDGGVTWTRCRMYWECWQPLAVPKTGTYFASTDEFTGSAQPTPMLLRSDDGGYSFAPTLYNGTNDTLTEDVVGDACSIFAPSAFTIIGLWYSLTDGTTWQTFPQAPAPPIDTRIYASPDTIWSFMNNVLECTPRPASNPIHIFPSDSIAFTKASCGNTSDTVIHIFGCLCANGDVLDSTRIGQTGGTFTSIVSGWPRTLCPTPSSPAGFSDSVHIQYSPSGINPAIGADTIWYLDNGTKKDTIIHLWGNGVTPGLTLVNPDFTKTGHTISFRESACGDTGDCFTIVNTSCSDVTLKHVNFLGDTGILQFNLPSPLPTSFLTLHPGDVVQICVSFLATLADSTNQASISFDWQSGTTTGTTPTVTVNGLTISGTHPEFRGLNLHAASCCNVPDDTTIYFVNTTSCTDTLLLYTPVFFDESDPGLFSLDSEKMFGKGPHFPIKVPPNAFIPLPIRICGCHAGDFKDSIRFIYSFGPSASGPQTVFGQWDTVLHMHVDGTGDIEPTVNTNKVSWLASSCDTAFQYKTITVTAGCKADTMESSPFDSAGGTFSYSPHLTFPHVMQPYDQLTFQLGYKPPLDTVGKITFNFLNECLSPSSESLSVQLNGSSTSEATAPLSSNNVDFGTLPCGTGACDTLWMKASTCGDAKISFISGPGNPFSLDSPAAGTVISKGDSIRVIVCINPTDTGARSDAIVFQISNPTTGQVGVPDTLALVGYLTPPSPSFTLTQLASITMRACDTLDEQFVFTNTGSCYTYVLTGASSPNGTKVTTTTVGSNFPDSVAPGGSVKFNVKFDPQGQSGSLNDSITIVDASGQTIKVPYDITVDSCQTTGGFHVAMPGNLIATPNCVTGTLVFTVNAGGGTGTVTSVSITGVPRFSLTNTNGGAMLFTDTILFDPNQPGGNTATLTIKTKINGTEHDTTISITGSTIGTKYSARIGVTTPTDSCISPNDTDLKEFDVMVYDSIPDALGVDSLSFVLNYNGDLLWNPQNVFGPGWQLVSETPENDGLHITLKYTGSGTGAVAAGQAVIKIKELGALAKILSDTAHVTSPHFNDSAFEACTLKAIAASGDSNSAPICINAASCPQNILARDMNGTFKSVPVDSLIIIPNPIRQDGTAATLNFHTTVAGAATVEVVNELGNPVTELVNGPVIKGDHIVPILTNNMAQGAYFVRITMNGYTVVRTFVLEKE